MKAVLKNIILIALVVCMASSAVYLKSKSDFMTTPARKLTDKVVYESKSFVDKLKFYAQKLNSMKTEITNLKGSTFGNLNKAIDKVDGLMSQSNQSTRLV